MVLQLDLSDRLLQTKGGFIILCLVFCQSQFLVRSFSPARKLLSLELKTSVHVVKNAEFHSAFRDPWQSLIGLKLVFGIFAGREEPIRNINTELRHQNDVIFVTGVGDVLRVNATSFPGSSLTLGTRLERGKNEQKKRDLAQPVSSFSYVQHQCRTDKSSATVLRYRTGDYAI